MRCSVLNISQVSILEQALRRCKAGALMAVTVGAFSWVGLAPMAAAQQAPAQVRQMHDFDVPVGPLSASLLRFGAQSGLQFNVDSRLTDGKRTDGVRGRYSVEGGLNQLLAGSGLTFRYAGPRTVLIEAVPDAGNARVLGPLRIEGSTGDLQINNANGSGDTTATEGSGSYTSGALNIASKTPLSLQQTPQSVSVITHQRLVEQNITDFSSLMNQSTGISTVTGANGPLQAEFYSRGFRIQRIQMDGGAPMDIANPDYGMVPQLDMAMYDHAEILRGADGLYNGYGQPGGVISLVRKRALDHAQVIVEGQAGSWNNYRTMFDATGPLALDGSLRGRGVVVWQDQDYFYDIAHNEKKMVYGVVDWDATPSTVIGIGASRTWQDALPFAAGLPRYRTGASLDLSRDTCLCVPWGQYDIDTTEIFGRVEQTFGEHWNLTMNWGRTKQERVQVQGTVNGPINVMTDGGGNLYQGREQGVSTQVTGDLTLAGSFKLFGHEQTLVVGTNYAEADGAGATRYTSPAPMPTPVRNIREFDPYDPAYARGSEDVRQSYSPEDLSRQFGAYASLRMTFWEPLHLNIGMRYSKRKSSSISQLFCAQVGGCQDFDTGEAWAQGELLFTGAYRVKTRDLSWPPQVSLVYDIRKSLSVYASYTDVYLEQSGLLGRDGSEVEPITGSNIEGGIKWAGRDGRLNASLAVYRIEQSKFAQLDGDFGNPDDYFSPDGGTRYCCYTTDADLQRVSSGVDLEVNGEILPGWQLSFGYTSNKNEETGTLSFQNGAPLESRLPRHLLKVWTSYQFQNGEWLRRLSIGGGANAQSSGYFEGNACLAYDITGSTCTGGFAPFQFTQGAYVVVAARAAYQVDDHWSVALNLNNLFDRTYYQTVQNSVSGNWYGEPRNLMLSIRGQF
ncbi:TonB-dependent siderophore receptor|uniref:TonB-dependent siderophore receptor n=1 Tax=Stenotrophomonas sp. SbOxS2 TaxID=2723885 RepID=UPI0015D208F7|nr:TonB-dependent receptor [Stenotrophomonas sp. SbOxS2]NYT99473.1 TonB-dependent siderophore receptor [Stenotrophomonas sp. SbOxS2]